MMANKEEKTVRVISYLPVAMECIPCDMGLRVEPQIKPSVKVDGLILEAWSWLATHPQADNEIRRRAAFYLHNYERASQIEVAAALLSDLPTDVDLTGINPKTVQLAQRNSKVFSIEEIKNENSDLSVLRYRIWRCLAECGESLEWAEFEQEYDVARPEREKKIKRWIEIARLMLEKHCPELNCRATDLKRRIVQLVRLFSYLPEKPLGYQIKGTTEIIDNFCSQYTGYFLFNELRVDQETLWISHGYFAYTPLVRLMDWMIRRNRGIHVSLLSQRKVKKIPNRQYNDKYLEWLAAVDRILTNALVIDPAGLIYEGRKVNNLDADINRVGELAYGKLSEPVNFDSEWEEAKLQKNIRMNLPKDAVSSFEWKKSHQGQDLYVLSFNFVFKERQLFPLDTSLIPGRKLIIDWIAENVPEITLRPFYFEEYNSEDGSFSIQSPYKGELVLDGPKEAIEKFDKAWSDSDGASLDPRWQLIKYVESRRKL